jgi:AraC-like DNA-binding protein
LTNKIVILKPSLFLQPYIKYYKYIESDLNGIYNCIPIPDVELYFNFTQINIFSKDYFNIVNPKIFITGLLEPDQEAYSHMTRTNRCGGFAIVFQPLGFYSLFKVKSSDFSKYVLTTDLILKKEIDEVWSQMEHEEDVNRMKDTAEKFLLKYALNVVFIDHCVEHIIEYMNLNNGIVRITQICQKFDISPRKLERSFKEETGLTAKDFLNIFRLNHALKLLSVKPDYDFTEISYLCGYYDQSHFIKDIRKRTSLTPGELASTNHQSIHSVVNINFIRNNEDQNLFISDVKFSFYFRVK